MKYIVFVVLFAVHLLSHNLNHSVQTQQSVVVSFSFSQEDDFSFENYEVYAPNSEIPFVIGRTDALSRVSFLPNRVGKWKVKAFSEDGHGKIVEIDIDESMKTKIDTTSSATFLKIAIGLMVIFGLFALLSKRIRKNEKN